MEWKKENEPHFIRAGGGGTQGEGVALRGLTLTPPFGTAVVIVPQLELKPQRIWYISR
jgi:hypothetical protein